MMAEQDAMVMALMAALKESGKVVAGIQSLITIGYEATASFRADRPLMRVSEGCLAEPTSFSSGLLLV